MMVVNIIITAIASNIPGMQLFEMKFKEIASHTGLASGYSGAKKKLSIHCLQFIRGWVATAAGRAWRSGTSLID